MLRYLMLNTQEYSFQTNIASMAILYKMMAINDNLNAETNKKTGYYPVVVRNKTLSISDLAHVASELCSLKSFEIEMAAKVLLEAIEDQLRQSNNVCLDGFGTFSVTAESRRVNSPDELRAESIHVKKVNFKCSPLLLKKMKNATFQKHKQP